MIITLDEALNRIAELESENQILLEEQHIGIRNIMIK